jgi:hypothetical protein
MTIKGMIEIDVEQKTVTIRLENGSYCLKHYTHGIKRFLDEEILFVQHEQQVKEE